jgi:hypothetical protein
VVQYDSPYDRRDLSNLMNREAINPDISGSHSEDAILAVVLQL